MKFIDALRLKSKLLFLFILITLGLSFIGIVGTLNITSMKKNLDSLYFGSFVTVLELDEILDAYHIHLQTNIYLAKNNIMNSRQTAATIKQAIKKIDKNWNSYKNQYKSNDEIPYINYATKEIEKSKKYLQKLEQICLEGKEVNKISIKTLTSEITHIDEIVSKLRAYEIDSAQFQRKELLDTYYETKIKLGIILFFVIGGVLLISFIVFKSIQKDQSDLEVASRKLKEANRKLENASYTDSLTNLHNRRYFNLVFEREVKRAKRVKNQITFMMLDVDYFKQYNDTYGHIEGDKALKEVARVLKSVLKRPSDFVFRLGGEEFGVLITDVDAQDSATLAQKICTEMEESKIPHSGSKVSDYLTLSIGLVSCIADEALNEEDIIKQADKKLYEAKESGRNRYIMSNGVIG
ncbi:diguanylate cyclase [Sulfurimonas sp. HSL-1716]|uniref:diguanylate cyclase domain-containing protein n=1 Tax=Hydrocurvibacter sulfurireducens TaxID=3131937 RepID=UPI0031F959A9